MSFIDWLKQVIRDEHSVPDSLRRQHQGHVEVLHEAVVAVEGIDLSSPASSRALVELRTLEAVARKR